MNIQDIVKLIYSDTPFIVIYPDVNNNYEPLIYTNAPANKIVFVSQLLKFASRKIKQGKYKTIQEKLFLIQI